MTKVYTIIGYEARPFDVRAGVWRVCVGLENATLNGDVDSPKSLEEAKVTLPELTPRYSNLGLLGEGGSGRVFRVRDSLRDCELALKLVTSEERAFLRREFETLRQIRHENLIQVLDWGTLPSGDAYYTMELVAGDDWGRRPPGAQSQDDVRRILTGLLRGLAHLHCHGEIHGDLKPGNILLAMGGVVKVSDVGMGDAGGSGKNLSGTPGYAAPEVWEGAKADVRSDLYSVGVMAYEALTGVHPFVGKTIREVVTGQIQGWVPTPGVHGVKLPADLERTVMRALERDPGLRQGSADEFMNGIGIKDRVGEILGGRFVDRDSELEQLFAALQSKNADRPTLVRIVGPPGVGTSRLASEFADRAIVAGARVDYLGPESAVFDAQPRVFANDSELGSNVRIASLADLYLKRVDHSRLLVLSDEVEDSGSRAGSVVEELARYIWAIAGERNEAIPILFVASGRGAASPSGDHAIQLSVGPLERASHDSLVRGLLGKASLSNTAMEKLFVESGGNPGACHSLLLDLVGDGVLARNDGAWTENPAGAIQSLQFAYAANPLSTAMRRTDQESLDVLISLGLIRNGVPAQELEEALQIPEMDGVLYRLSTKGWVRSENGRWLLTSGAVRSGALEAGGPARIREVARRLRGLPPTALDRAAALEVDLAAEQGEGMIQRAIELSGPAIMRGNAVTATRWLERAISSGSVDAGREKLLQANVMLAEALLALGEYERALIFLGNGGEEQPARLLIDRELAMGRALRALGQLDTSRQAFERARWTASSEGLLGLQLTSETYLAGIDWELGDEMARSEAIARVTHMLSGTPARRDLVNERAALAYNLGAAMIRAGRYSDARAVLSEAEESEPSRYWQMRIRNALSIANFRLGKFDLALTQIDEAWQLVEDIGADSFRPRILTNKGGYQYGLGKIREAAESNRQGARWAQRFGDSFEYLVGCAGAAICLTVMGRYEDGMAEARLTERTARSIGDSRHLARALEIQTIIHLNLGMHDDAEELLDEARAAYRGHEYVDLGPRLDWLSAQLLDARGKREQAMKQLREIESALQAAPDLEDLWGVQVELNLLAAEESPRDSLAILLEIAERARMSSVLVAEVAALAAIGQIHVERGVNHGDLGDLLASGLARAEEQGLLESSWQLSYWLGRIAVRSGNRKAVQSRFGHATRVLREISGALTTDHARSYLNSPRVSSALRQMGVS